MSAPGPISIADLREQERLAGDIKSAWLAGAEPDARSAVDDRIPGTCHRSVLLDLAYEEYCQRLERGENVDVDAFVTKYSRIGESLRRQIRVHSFLDFDGALSVGNGVDEWPGPKDEIAGFILVEELGRGSFARVFLAEEVSLRDRVVVVKITAFGQHEAEMMAMLEHPGIVPVYSVRHDPEWNLTAICMPFVSRATLLDCIEATFSPDGPLPHAGSVAHAVRGMNCVDDVVLPSDDPSPSTIWGTYTDAVIRTGIHLAEALQAAHERGVYHRDIKPSNILVSSSGRPLLIDFNLSSDPGADIPIGGTIPYMAPEQLARYAGGESGSLTSPVDGRADLYSLGVTLVEMLTGRHPFGPFAVESSNPGLAAQLLERQADGPRILQQLDGRVGTQLIRVLESCVEFRPDDRPQNAGEVATALRAAMRPGRRLLRVAHTRRNTTAGLLATISFLVSATVVWWVNRPSAAELAFAAATEHVARKEFHDAEQQLQAVLDEEPENVDALTLRGLARLRLDRFDGAYTDFTEAWELQPEQDYDRAIAYCLVRMGYSDRAIERYRRLLEDNETAELHNNIGCALLNESAFAEAEQHFERALKLVPQYAVSLLNSAKLALDRVGPSGERIPEAGVRRVEQAVARNIPSGELYLLAARTHARSESPDIDKIVDYLSKAVQLGLSQDRIRTDQHFSEYLDTAELQNVIARAPEQAQLTRAVRLIPPFLSGR